jgi:hypothetical protein
MSETNETREKALDYYEKSRYQKREDDVMRMKVGITQMQYLLEEFLKTPSNNFVEKLFPNEPDGIDIEDRKELVVYFYECLGDTKWPGDLNFKNKYDIKRLFDDYKIACPQWFIDKYYK